MSIRSTLQRIARSIFGQGSRPSSSPGSADSFSTAGPQVTYVVRSQIPEITHAFSYGYLDGSRGTERENFEAFIRHSVEEDRTESLLREVEEQERELQQIGTLQGEISQIEARRVEERERSSELHEAIEKTEQEQRETAHRGSLLFAALYSVAGLFFILGDIVMSRQTVSEALELVGREAWVFAIGLAMLAVLLKPAYDRLVEEPFWRDNTVRIFMWTILGVALFAVTTLLVLGAFRSEAFVTNAEIEMVQLDPTRTDAEKQSLIQAARENLLNSQLGRLSFMLTSILFAVAGAICLGIGLRHVHDWYHVRRKLHNRLRAFRKQSQDADAMIEMLRQDLARASTELARLAIDDALPLREVRERLEALHMQRIELLQTQNEAYCKKLLSLYRDGYCSGELRPVDQRNDERSRVTADYVGRSKAEVGAGGNANEVRRQPARPYLAVRHAIQADTIGRPLPLSHA